MVQCAACGKFMGAKGGVTCPKCKSKSHNECVRIPIGATVSDAWRCGECQSKVPKGRDTSTPIRSVQDSYHTSVPCADSITGTQSQTEADVVISLREEMRSEFSKMHDLMSSEFKTSKQGMASVQEEMRELRKEISAARTAFNERMDGLEARVAALEQAQENTLKSPETISLEQALVEVRSQLNEREQDYFLNDVVLTGIPDEKGENPTHLILLLGAKIGVKLDERDIVLAEREGAPRRSQDAASMPARTRRVIVRFSRRGTRDAFIQAARVRRDLTSTELGMEGTTARIYVNERLTRANGQLFAKTRARSRENNWRYCWTREGRIYVRKEHGTPYFRIKNDCELDKIF